MICTRLLVRKPVLLPLELQFFDTLVDIKWHQPLLSGSTCTNVEYQRVPSSARGLCPILVSWCLKLVRPILYRHRQTWMTPQTVVLVLTLYKVLQCYRVQVVPTPKSKLLEALWIDGPVFSLFSLVWSADARIWLGIMYFVFMLREHFPFIFQHGC